LVVDDEPGIRSALERWFRVKGFQVDSAHDGAVAVEMCRENAYDIITMDLEMPRMGGLAAMAAIREFAPDLPIVVLTGYSKNEEAAWSVGANEVLIKPLRLPELEAHVRRVLEAC
jgi:CheY-like chemotaxis protein